MKFLYRILLLMCIGVLIPAYAESLSAYADQTVDGQIFTFDFSSVELSDGSDGILTIHTQSDYGLLDTAEYLTWDIDNLGIGGIAGPAVSNPTIIHYAFNNDTEWLQSFNISGSDLQTATSDGMLSLVFDLSDDVNLGGFTFTQNPYIDITLEYNISSVPVPAAIWLFVSGLVGIVGLSARKKV